MRSKKKRFNKKIIIILLIIICICVAMVAATLVFAKYKLTLTTTHSIESTHFYFESDLADTEDKNYYIISNDSNINEEIEFYVRNYTNDTLYSDEDITYTVLATPNDDDITVKILDDDGEISGSQTLTGDTSSINNYKLQITGSGFTESKSFDITLTISSNAPYEKTLTSTITVSNTIAENEVSLDVSSNEEYATLSIIVNVLADITISYDSSNLTVDQNSLSNNMEDDLDGTISVSSGGMTLGETYNIIFIISGGNSDISIENGDVKVE